MTDPPVLSEPTEAATFVLDALLGAVLVPIGIGDGTFVESGPVVVVVDAPSAIDV